MLSAMDNQVRKSILTITSSIVRCTADLLSIARSLPIQHSLPIIGKSHVISYLLPYVVANVGFVVESDTKVMKKRDHHTRGCFNTLKRTRNNCKFVLFICRVPSRFWNSFESFCLTFRLSAWRTFLL